ncbi:MAG: hypothetical protein Q4A60_07305 [Pasteurellaceae bacterium]|nr:hypothetical protein [Pasteurellaceae bacterium]
MRWRFVLLIFSLLLTACSQSLKVKSLPPQPVESRLFAVEQLAPKNEKSLLAVQFLPDYWRWVQTDPLGSPIARLQLSQNGWQNDGFVMPNSQAQRLFSAIATYLNPNNPPFELSEDHKMWHIVPRSNGTTITLSDHSQWSISEIIQ